MLRGGEGTEQRTETAVWVRRRPREQLVHRIETQARRFRLARGTADEQARGPPASDRTAIRAGRSWWVADRTQLKTRRSIRTFRDKPLAKDIIEKIIEGARFAPSGHNSQSTEYLVVQDKAVLNQVSATVIEYLKFEVNRFGNPFFRTMALLGNREKAESGLHEIPGFKRMIQMYESGSDPILNGAPVLLAFHARRTVGYADINAQPL